MELFTFLRMGGSHDRIEIYLITNPDKSKSAAQLELKENLATFDAEKARCFLEKDRQRMLAAVEASFGDCKEFNMKMRNIFESRLVRGSSRGRSKRVTPAEAEAATHVLGTLSSQLSSARHCE